MNKCGEGSRTHDNSDGDEQGLTHLINPGIERGSMIEIVYATDSPPYPWLVSDGKMAAHSDKGKPIKREEGRRERKAGKGEAEGEGEGEGDREGAGEREGER